MIDVCDAWLTPLLPAGFQAWDTVQALCSYVRGMLSSQAILKGVGVGQQVRWGPPEGQAGLKCARPLNLLLLAAAFVQHR